MCRDLGLRFCIFVANTVKNQLAASQRKTVLAFASFRKQVTEVRKTLEPEGPGVLEPETSLRMLCAEIGHRSAHLQMNV